MSLIIDECIFSFQNPKSHNSNNSPPYNSKAKNKFLYNTEINHRNFQNFALEKYTQTNKICTKLVISFKKKILGLLDVWYVAKLDQQTIFLQEKIIIAKDQLPFRISPLKKKLEVIRQICRSKQGQPKFTKIYVSQQGSIICILPRILLFQNIINTFKVGMQNITKTHFFASYVQNIIKFILIDCKQTFCNIFKNLSNLTIDEEVQIDQQRQEEMNRTKFHLYRYLARSSIELRFDCTEGSALYEQVVNITVNEQQQIEERISFMKQANNFKLASLGLFTHHVDLFEDKEKEVLYMTVRQKQSTKILLEIPETLPIKQGSGLNHSVLQNKYLFNQIILEPPCQNQQLNLLGQSGFGRIEFGIFNFWYMLNSKIENGQIEENFKRNNKIRNKFLVVKSPKSHQNTHDLQKYLQKQLHQLNIINRLKGLSCALIPRYYQVESFYPKPFTEQQKNYFKKYENALLSELTSCYGQPGYNLGNLIEDSWQSLTLKKIVYIMSQVAQALRFLHLNKIVHLDLKPENILFLKSFNIKLIDFGESFHPLVCEEGNFLQKEDSQPAFSYPYGCPEIAQELKFFTEKSDVFSFGIILYELLYGKDLITTTPSQLLSKYRTKDYIKQIFLNIQELEIHGQTLILPILNHLIIKCVSPEIQNRPSITWISVLLKNFLQILP